MRLAARFRALGDAGTRSSCRGAPGGLRGDAPLAAVRVVRAAIALSTNADVGAVCERLMCGSRNHLRAFARTGEVLTGQPYVAQVLKPARIGRPLLKSCRQRQ
jgi:hypothetical protein